MEQKQQIAVRNITLMIVASAFTYALVNGLPNLTINELIEEFGISGTQQGLVSSSLNFGILAAVVIAPMFQGRIPKIPAYLFAVILMAVSVIGQALSPNMVVFFAFSVALGLGSGWLDGYMNSLMIDVHPNDSTVPMGLLHGFYGIGSLLFPLIATALLAVMAWRGLYWIDGILVIALIVVIFLVHKQSKACGLEEKIKEERLQLKDLWKYIQDKRSVVLLILSFAAGCIQTGVSCWLVRFMTIEYDNAALGATALSAMWVLSTINRFISPRLKVSPIRLIIVGSAATALCLGLGVVIHSALFMLLMIAAVGLFSGHLVPMIFIEAAQAHEGNTTMTTFIMQIAMAIGRTLIPILMAFFSNNIGIRWSMLLPAVAALVAAFCGMKVVKGEKTVNA